MTNITTHDFFIDSSCYDNTNNFNVMLDNPIIVPEKSKAYVCIKNFSMLNAIYNISEDLLNNTINIIATRKHYTKTKSGDLIYLFNQADFFKQDNPEIYHPLFGIISWKNGIEILTTTAYNMYFKTSIIQTTNTSVTQQNSIIRNIFDEDVVNTTNYFRWKIDSYLIIKKNTTIFNGDFMSYIVFERLYTKPNAGSLLPTANSERIRIYGSHDGINWVEATYGAGNIAITWTTGDLASVTATKQYNLALNWVDDYIWYKIEFESTQDPDMYYSYYQTTKCYLKKYSITNVVFDYTSYQAIPLTIPDGVYSITTLNNKINELLIISGFNNVKADYLTYNYKWTLTSSEFPYVYSAVNKIDLQFNLHFDFNEKLKKMLGIVNDINIIRTSLYTGQNTINLIGFKKIVLSSSLKLKVAPETVLHNTDKSSGVGDILLWLDRDISPFEYLNWSNATDYKLQIDNKNINNINFQILNEFKQVLNVPSCLFYFEITIIDNEK